MGKKQEEVKVPVRSNGLEITVDISKDKSSVLKVLSENTGVELWRLETLTEKELYYFSMMAGQHGVLYVKAKPGVAKSAIGRSIAYKLDMEYFDIRLAMVDETDVGLYPAVIDLPITITTTNAEGKVETKETTRKFLDHVVPKWAWLANQRRTLVHFEELNRASLPVRNAALQILLERGIGIEFKFNKNVFFMASGNLGDDDGTEVEEFDAALRNRLITIYHDLTVPEWMTWAKGRIHPDIIQFLENNKEYSYTSATEQADAFATFRSWHFLSDYLKVLSPLKKDDNGEVIIDDNTGLPEVNWISSEHYILFISAVGSGYIGETFVQFFYWVEDKIKLNIKDIIEKFKTVKSSLQNYERSKYTELIQDLARYEPASFQDYQIENIHGFLQLLNPEEVTAYVLKIFDNPRLNISETQTMKLLRPYVDIVDEVQNISKKLR